MRRLVSGRKEEYVPGEWVKTYPSRFPPTHASRSHTHTLLGGTSSQPAGTACISAVASRPASTNEVSIDPTTFRRSSSTIR